MSTECKHQIRPSLASGHSSTGVSRTRIGKSGVPILLLVVTVFVCAGVLSALGLAQTTASDPIKAPQRDFRMSFATRTSSQPWRAISGRLSGAV